MFNGMKFNVTGSINITKKNDIDSGFTLKPTQTHLREATFGKLSP